MSLVLVMLLDLVADQMPQLMLRVAEGLLRWVAEKCQSHLGFLRFGPSIANAALHEVSQVGRGSKVEKELLSEAKLMRLE